VHHENTNTESCKYSINEESEGKVGCEAKQEEKCRLAININFLINIRCHAARVKRLQLGGRGLFLATVRRRIPFLIHRRLFFYAVDDEIARIQAYADTHFNLLANVA
jgi:hypothetical protein